MSPDNRDLTIDAVLTDPMIRAVMRADGVALADFEMLLRTTAHRLAEPPRRLVPAANVPPRKLCPSIVSRCFA